MRRRAVSHERLNRSNQPDFLQSANASGYDGPEVAGPGEPCFDAKPLPDDIEKIAEIVNVPVWGPTNQIITDAWRCGGTPVLMFDHIQVSYEDGWNAVDVEDKWEALIADYGGHIESLAGHQALVESSGDTGANNQVLIVHEGTLVRLLATPAVPITDLTALADSLKLPA